MRPGDHPEFFRFPPPPGQSRESSIRLDADGRFWHEGELVEHPGMQAAFASWIGRHPDDDRYILSNGYDWSYFEVEDVPFFVRGVRVLPGGLELTLSDRTAELLEPESLRQGPRDALYCQVKAGRFGARFTPGAQLALSPLLSEGADGDALLEIAGRQYRLPR
jgi:hypothetical protein